MQTVDDPFAEFAATESSPDATMPAPVAAGVTATTATSTSSELPVQTRVLPTPRTTEALPHSVTPTAANHSPATTSASEIHSTEKD